MKGNPTTSADSRDRYLLLGLKCQASNRLTVYWTIYPTVTWTGSTFDHRCRGPPSYVSKNALEDGSHSDTIPQAVKRFGETGIDVPETAANSCLDTTMHQANIFLDPAFYASFMQARPRWEQDRRHLL